MRRSVGVKRQYSDNDVPIIVAVEISCAPKLEYITIEPVRGYEKAFSQWIRRLSYPIRVSSKYTEHGQTHTPDKYPG